MSKIVDSIRRARETGDLNALVGEIPYAQFVGVTMDCSGEEVIGKLGFVDHLIGNSEIPALHGGTVGALLESTAIFTLIMKAETFLLPKTINITIDYLRTGHARDTFAAAELTKVGRRVANVRATAWQDDRNKPIAVANAHFLLKPGDDSSALDP